MRKATSVAPRSAGSAKGGHARASSRLTMLGGLREAWNAAYDAKVSASAAYSRRPRPRAGAPPWGGGAAAAASIGVGAGADAREERGLRA